MVMKTIQWLLVGLIVGMASISHVEAETFIGEIPIIDYPFTRSNEETTWPSMKQSLHLTKGYYQLVHLGIDRAIENKKGGEILTLLFDLVFVDGLIWLHEEWHRAVMSNRNIDSKNESYFFYSTYKDNAIYVSHVKDEDLVRLKSKHPADQVRLSSAGIESQYELNLALEKDAFFFDTASFDLGLLWINYFSNLGYVYSCTNGNFDEFAEHQNQKETTIKERDFTGSDCLAWVYDLHRPDESYTQRGVHPSGVGIDRYRKYSDLTQEEKKMIRLQLQLSLINFLDSNLIEKRRFRTKSFEWNLTGRHHLTSSGYTIEGNYFYKNKRVNALLIPRFYFNGSRAFPGMELQILRYPLSGWVLSPRLMVWQQPKDQRFKTRTAQSGGLVSMKAGIPWMDHSEATLEIESKTEGWVAGNVYLEANTSIRLGMTWVY